MSDDPKRLLDDVESSALERDLLESAGNPEPPDAARAAVWAALANRLPPPPGGGGGGGAGGMGVGSKIVAGIAIAAAIVGGGAFIASRPSKQEAKPTTTMPSASPASPTVASIDSSNPPPTVEPAPTVEVAPTAEAKLPPPKASVHHRPAHPSSVATHEAPSAKPVEPPAPTASISKADALREESALVGKARDALRRGDARTALTLAEEARTRFPSGVLVQEREVVAIEALAQSGDADGASRRATAFLRNFPSSPHTAHVKSYVR